MFTGFDPRGRLPFGRILAARDATYNEALMTSASQVGARVVDCGTWQPCIETTCWRELVALLPNAPL